MNRDDTVRDPTVLVVEDDEDLADSYSIWLEREGFDVRTAYGGEQALDRLDPAVDVVLLDRRMPDIPGDEVLERARQQPGSYQISMLTAVDPEVDILDLRFDEYLTKPVTKSELVDTVDQLLLRSTLDDDLQELFRLAVTRTTLRTQSGESIDAALEQLDEAFHAKQQEVDEKLSDLDDFSQALALVDQPAPGAD